ncbi:MAG: peptide-methionine (S)-S-oxide reductase MsrA [Alphaproteobacteria bacterium]
MSLNIDPWSFPDPEYTSAETGERSVVLGGGCFWCTEAVYKELDGVLRVRPGYAGDAQHLADYRTVCSGQTRHAEVVEIVYDAARIDLGQILKVFFAIAHDPTQKDRQGHDVGPQYRSVIFYADGEQKQVAERYIAQLEELRAFSRPIVTELSPLETFFEAESYHHDYAALNPGQPYIRGISMPKVQKLRSIYPDKLKRPDAAE